jgi:hypothetical protein
VADWIAISGLATAGGTLALAATTYASVRSANRAARVAELSLLAGLRPLLVESGESSETLRVNFYDIQGIAVPGGRAAVELVDDRLFVVLSLRNVGSGIAVLHGGTLYPRRQSGNLAHPEVDTYRRLQRDLYIPPGDIGFWQIAWRPDEIPAPPEILEAIERGYLVADVLYGDFEGGQRAVVRLGLSREEDGAWHTSTVRHWQVDRAEPRERADDG